MIIYADFAYYSGTYKGAVIGIASFDLYARKATLEIKKHAFGNIVETSLTDEIRMCCCEVADLLYKSDQEDTKGIASEKVGEYSVSYVAPEAKEKLLSLSIRSIIYNWLAMTGLLYRGCS